MKHISIIIASLILSVSIYLSCNIIVSSYYAPDVNFANAKGLTMSIIEKSDAINQRSVEELTDITTNTYQKVLKRLAEIEEEHYAQNK